MEHLDVLIVGAGLSGIGAGHYLQTECPWASYAIFEARDAIGGTWDLFRYPGIRSDSDMFTLGYSFRPWDGAKSIADGASILQYIKDTAAEAGIDEHIRFDHRIVAADWSTAGRPLERHRRADRHRRDGRRSPAASSSPAAATTATTTATSPTSPAWTASAAPIVHPQAWPEDLDYAGKRVVVIGSGATAVTLVPSLADRRRARHHAPAVAELHRLDAGEEPGRRRCCARSCPPASRAALIRWLLALGTQAFYQLSQRRPELVKRMLRKGLERQLPAGYDIDTHFTPRYNPWDQRLCVVPDGDLFKAIRAGTASVVTDHIDTFTETGLLLESGDRARGRHHRHRHRPRAAVHRRHRAVGRRRGRRPRRAS